MARDAGPGQAIMYGTTPTFLEKLGLNSLSDLPPIAEFVPGADVVEALEYGLRIDVPAPMPQIEPPLWEQWATKNAALPQGERLQKVLAIRGWGSRRVCEDLIATGGSRSTERSPSSAGGWTPRTTVIEVDGVPIGVRPGLVYYLLNKPVGIVTTSSDTQGRQTVVELVPDEPRVYPVGRLDIDTEGLLLLTNDGDLAQRLTHPSHGVERSTSSKWPKATSPRASSASCARASSWRTA